MKHFIFVLILFACCHNSKTFSQSQKHIGSKPPVDLSVLGKFPAISGATLSNDGNYVIYSVNNPATFTNTSYLQSLQSDWNIKLGAVACQFTADNKYVIYQEGKDSLALLLLANKQAEHLVNISSYKVSDDGKWIAYVTSQKKLILKNLDTKKEQSLEEATDYFFSPTGIFIQSLQGGNYSLSLFTFNDNAPRPIWKGQEAEKPGNYTFSKDGKMLAYVTENKTGKKLWSYKTGTDGAVEIAGQELSNVSADLFFNGINFKGFTDDGSGLFIELKEKKSVTPVKSVDIWSTADTRLQSEQLKQLKPKTFIALVSIATNKIIQLEKINDKLISVAGDYVLVANIKGDASFDEWYWNKAIKSEVWLISLKEGTRNIIADSLPSALAMSYWLSPTGKYVIYYDAGKKNYFSYETATGIKKNITQNVNAEWTKYDKRDIKMGKYMPIFSGSAGWLKDDKAIILYSQCDIYLCDPSGKSAPINLTNGLGKKNNIEFRLAIENSQVFNDGETIYLSAFNRINKKDGFYKVELGKNKSPELLTVESAIYKGTWEDERFIPVYPVKAKDAQVYVVRKMTASESPNYYWTADFRDFHKITDIHPEKHYNWLTTELINWKTTDGKSCQGILYKPQDFDPAKKYPVIFHYYERVTEALNIFISPDISHGELNIPFFVSNGYLVFTPDFVYEQGHPGNSVLNIAVSAAQHLSKLPYVDSKHIGLQGHSRGGWETNYLITHTSIFAAAVSASGMSNYISLFNGIRSFRNGISRQSAFEQYYQRIGATLWDKPELFIENSPVFKVNKITTPVLMMCNKEDDDVPFEQGIEFFTALRRSGKKAWLLQYDEGDHMVFGDDAKDFTRRMLQFFDCYLKNEKPPKWMLDGVPAREKIGFDDKQ